MIESMRAIRVANGDPKATSVTLDTLPPEDTKRWVVRRKAAVVQAVRDGLISLDDACNRYTLSVEEFLSWERAIDEYGLRGLRVTRLQEYRLPSHVEE